MVELMAKAAKIMNAEEAMTAKKNEDTKETKVEDGKTERKDQKNNGGNRQSKAEQTLEQMKKFGNYTPVKVDINHILEEIKNSEELAWPTKMKVDPD